MVDGNILWCSASAVFMRLAAPAAVLVCPICDLTLPSAMCCFFELLSPKVSFKAVNSDGSPATVPVPCASIKPTLVGVNPAES